MCLKSDWCEGLDVTYDGVAVSWKDQLDPFILYLEKLREWDGTPRIDDLLTHFFESESPAELRGSSPCEWTDP